RGFQLTALSKSTGLRCPSLRWMRGSIRPGRSSDGGGGRCLRPCWSWPPPGQPGLTGTCQPLLPLPWWARDGRSGSDRNVRGLLADLDGLARGVRGGADRGHLGSAGVGDVGGGAVRGDRDGAGAGPDRGACGASGEVDRDDLLGVV